MSILTRVELVGKPRCRCIWASGGRNQKRRGKVGRSPTRRSSTTFGPDEDRMYGQQVVPICNSSSLKAGKRALAIVIEHIRTQEIACEKQLPCSYLADRAAIPLAAPENVLYDPGGLFGVVSRDPHYPSEVDYIIARAVDGSRMHEFKPRFGTTPVSGFARIHGYSAGDVVNNGILFSAKALKADHFIELCNASRIPLAFLQNITGFMIGKEYERGGIAQDRAKMVMAIRNSTVPKFTVIIGGSYGAGNYGMCGRAYQPRLLFVWPQAKISVMGGEQAAGVLLTVKKDMAANDCVRRASVARFGFAEMKLGVVAGAIVPLVIKCTDSADPHDNVIIDFAAGTVEALDRQVGILAELSLEGCTTVLNAGEILIGVVNTRILDREGESWSWLIVRPKYIRGGEHTVDYVASNRRGCPTGTRSLSTSLEVEMDAVNVQSNPVLAANVSPRCKLIREMSDGG